MNIMDTLSKDLLKELECPVCLDYLLPPITLCKNGHSFCKECKSRLAKCPTCNGSLLQTRNICLENLARKLKSPCRYRESGCEETFPLDLITQHEDDCVYQPYKCPLDADYGCDWEGTMTDMKNHIKDECEPEFLREVTGNYITNLIDFEEDANWFEVVFTADEVFYADYALIENFLFCCILYVGAKNKASKYMYRTTITDRLGKESVSAYLAVHSYLEDIKEVHESGDCAVFYKQFAMKCMNEDRVLYVNHEICQTDS